MASLNRIILIGNLTKDPEVRSTPDGTSVATIRIAVNRSWTNKKGEREADFFTIVIWRKLAELCGQYLSKGSPVAIEGRLQSRNWETADGQKRYTVEVVADNVQFLSRAVGSSNNQTNDNRESSRQTDNQNLETVGADSKNSDDFNELPDDDVPF